MSSDEQPLYCGEGMDNFHTGYKNVHGYVSLVVCLLGTIANTLNIIVLTRREMRSPTNAILTGLAVADLAVMLEYIPYTIHDYILYESLPREQQLSYSWACFIKFHSIFAQVLHTISIWLTVTLAVWRYIAVGYPQKNRLWCGMRTTIITITTAYVVCVLVVSPSLYLVSAIAEFMEVLDEAGKTLRSIPLSEYVINYYNEVRNQTQNTMAAATATEATDDVAAWNATALKLLGNASATVATTAAATPTELPVTIVTTIAANILAKSSATTPPPTSPANSTTRAPMIERNVTVYRLFHSDLALHNVPLRNATFLIYSVVIKLIPCIALTILSVRLILALLEAKHRRKMLTSKPTNGTSKALENGKPAERPRKNSKTLEKEKQTDRTTRMLLAVLLLFLITEFPQGIMGLLNTILGDAFLMQCYLRLSDLMDILALINSSINFILYCTMSKQFRSTFTLLFRPKFLDKWLPVAQDEAAAARADGLQRSTVVPLSKCSPNVGGHQQLITTTVGTATTTQRITSQAADSSAVEDASDESQSQSAAAPVARRPSANLRSRNSLLNCLLCNLKRRSRHERDAQTHFQTIVIVVDKASGATDHQLYNGDAAAASADAAAAAATVKQTSETGAGMVVTPPNL